MRGIAISRGARSIAPALLRLPRAQERRVDRVGAAGGGPDPRAGRRRRGPGGGRAARRRARAPARRARRARRAKPVTSSETCTARAPASAATRRTSVSGRPWRTHQPPAAGAQLAVERLQAAEHPGRAAVRAEAPAQQRGVEDEQRHDALVLAAGVRRARAGRAPAGRAGTRRRPCRASPGLRAGAPAAITAAAAAASSVSSRVVSSAAAGGHRRRERDRAPTSSSRRCPRAGRARPRAARRPGSQRCAERQRWVPTRRRT